MKSTKEFVEHYGLSLTASDMSDLLAAISVADHERDLRWMKLFSGNRSSDFERDLINLMDITRRESTFESGNMSASEARLHSLREEMERLELNSLYIPHNDQFIIKFLPKCSERVEWLTAFGGSAGEVVVLKDKAAIFTDGRYIDLVAEVSDMNLFSAHLMNVVSPLDWLATQLQKGGTLGVATALHSSAWLDRAQRYLAENDIILVPLEEHPIDVIWQSRPPEPVGAIEVHPIELAGRTTSEKLALVEPLFERVDAIFLNVPETICWLCNVRGADVQISPIVRSMAIVRKHSVDWFVDERKIPKSTEFESAINVCPLSSIWRELERLRDERVLYSPGHTNGRVVNTLKAAGAHLEAAADPFLVYKACKTDEEQEASQRAHYRDGLAVVKFLHWFENEAKRGALSELSAAKKMDEFRSLDASFRGVSFTTNASVGPHGAMPHYHPTEESSREIEVGDLFLLDAGGQYQEGTTDITRTVSVGEPTARMKSCYTHVLKAHIAVATLRFPQGARAMQLDAVGRSELWRAGLDFDHGTGHGVGSYLSVHEAPPSLGQVDNGHQLLPGMIFSNEPGFYHPGLWGIRIENLVLVKDTSEKDYRERPILCLHSLTLAPYCRHLIDLDLLTTNEIQWIDEYHERVRAELSDSLDAEVREWLFEATEPLENVVAS